MKAHMAILAAVLLGAASAAAGPMDDPDESAILATLDVQDAGHRPGPGEDADLPAYLTDSEADTDDGSMTVVAVDVPL